MLLSAGASKRRRCPMWHSAQRGTDASLSIRRSHEGRPGLTVPKKGSSHSMTYSTEVTSAAKCQSHVAPQPVTLASVSTRKLRKKTDASMALLFYPRSMPKSRRQMSYEVSLCIMAVNSVCSIKTCTHKTALCGTTTAVATCGQIDNVKLSRDQSPYLRQFGTTCKAHQQNFLPVQLSASLCGLREVSDLLLPMVWWHVRNCRRRLPFPTTVAQGERAPGTCQCALSPPPLAQN